MNCLHSYFQFARRSPTLGGSSHPNVLLQLAFLIYLNPQKTNYWVFRMPYSTSGRTIHKNSKSKRKQKRPESPNKSEPGDGSDGPRVIATDDAIYFFRPKGEHGYLSQWYASSFTDGIHSYRNAEQYMMHRKGILFAPDSHITSAILETTNPHDIKALGRMIPNFDETIWERERLNIVTEGSRLKFRQTEALKAQLLATEDKELVEASPFDRIWGVGFGAKQAPMKRNKWGENLLGKALMTVRQELQEEVAKAQHSSEDQRSPVQSVRVLPSPTQAKLYQLYGTRHIDS
ncbi:hypothetical protein OPQ81_005851 [Rhizoctonia solani]|nr:hypothetical protein OPQ81_005851 [Rhizoctonia solani]